MCWRSSLGLGDDESISKNKETINNPAIAAPIIIGDPISFLPSLYASVIPLSPAIFEVHSRELSSVFVPCSYRQASFFFRTPSSFFRTQSSFKTSSSVSFSFRQLSDSCGDFVSYYALVDARGCFLVAVSTVNLL
jgi:hypothetical protein